MSRSGSVARPATRVKNHGSSGTLGRAQLRRGQPDVVTHVGEAGQDRLASAAKHGQVRVLVPQRLERCDGIDHAFAPENRTVPRAALRDR